MEECLRVRVTQTQILTVLSKFCQKIERVRYLFAIALKPQETVPAGTLKLTIFVSKFQI